MASKNQVTLTFAGDSSKLSQAFDQVGASADGMKTKVGEANVTVGDRSGFDAAGSAADQTYSKFDALESVGRGTTDTMSGLSEIMKGNVLQGATDLAGGVAALADGFSGALLPAIKSVAKAGIANTVQTVRATAASVVHKGAMLAGAAATKVMTIAQRGLNLAMRANPIGIVITVLAALVAGIVIAYKRSATFRAVVQTAMRGIAAAFKWAVDKGAALIGWFKTLPGKVGGFVKGVSSVITRPFRDAFQAVRNAWNNTVGGKGFTVPDWIPGLGGKSFRIPYFHQGGIMPGAPGTEGLAMLQAGERVTRAGQSGGGVVEIRFTGTLAPLIKALRKEIRDQGGSVQAVLGS